MNHARYGGYLAVLNSRRIASLLPALHRFVQLDKDSLAKWFVKELRKMFSLKRDIVAFACVGLPMIVSLRIITDDFQKELPWFGTTPANWFALAAFAVWCFVVLHHVSFIVQVILLIRKLARLPVRISLHQHPQDSILAVGRLLFFISMSLSVGAALVYVGVWLSPIPVTWITLGWAMVLGILLMSVFVLPQYKIHLLMAKIKHDRLRDFGILVEKALNQVAEDPTDVNIERLSKLYSIREQLGQLSEWACDLRGLLTLLTTVAIPLVVAFIELWFR